MSLPKPPLSSTVLRQPSQAVGTRRLPSFGATVQTSTSSNEEPQPDVKQALRDTFALEFAEIERESREKGLLEGRQQARTQLNEALAHQEQQWLKKEASLRTALEAERLQLARLVEALGAQQKQLMASMEPLVGRLALAVVTRFLGQHAETRPLIADVARQAIEEHQLVGPMRIRVARVDYETLLRLAPDDALLASFQVDPQASPASCLIDFGGGQLDVGVQTQLANVAAVLNGGDGRVAGA
ncbi:Flagellar biosynthesis/type III secretory pathway protein FliH [Pseudomonas sp. NFACC15-1]|uniref:FliH/SctL family protein n=1 Tax=unclassified Pseudomonas TaxID=196821 RepID=UPI0008900A2F|nr:MULTISPECIES: FliH/SctL family protein [unclassified Pseudomonas]SDA89594.1 Flagellar biosynthesis/type III secretory pathway protein FliH [Pseudomonas sp. NFACC15-1]SDW12842.1 Flagellar biosynthesis/type III secretory pathway protein FliH [Pseudomonas sp. NFACC14]